MRNAWLWIVLAVAVAAVAWFFVGSSAGLGGGANTEADYEDDPTLMSGDDAVTLAASGTGKRAEKKDTEKLEPENDPLALGGFIVRGRVVDEKRRRLVAEVTVQFQGRDAVEGRTDAQGTFAIAVGELPPGPNVRGAVRAQTEGGLIALQQIWVWSQMAAEETDVGVLVARKGQPLTARVVSAGVAVPKARVAVLGADAWNNAIFMKKLTADDDGIVHVELAPPGRTVLLAAGGEGTGRGKASVTLPRADTSKPVDVELTDERVVDIEVVDKESGAPVVGARIHAGDRTGQPKPHGPGYLPEIAVPVTDEQGHATLRGLASGEREWVQLVVEAEGYPSPFSGSRRFVNANRANLKHDATEVRIEMQQNRSMTFPIKEGDVPPPPDGTVVTVKQRNFGPAQVDSGITAVVRDGEVVVDGLPPNQMSGMMTTEAGLLASFFAQAGKEEGKPVTFKKGYLLSVRVLDASGAPVVDKGVTLQARGGMWKTVGPKKTDEKGEVSFPPTDLKFADIRVMHDNSNWWNATTVSDVDLSKQTGIKVVQLPAQSTLALRLQLDGKAGLPSQYWINLNQMYVSPSRIEEDPATGELRVAMHLPDGDDPLKLTVSAEGHLPFTKDLARDELAAPVLVEMKPSGSIIVRYTKPVEGSFRLRPQKWDPEKEIWGRANMRNMGRPNRGGQKEENTQRFEGLDAGRYRVQESVSKLATEPFMVELGRPTEIEMDLSVLTSTEGRVDAPAGTNLRLARVRRTSDKNNGNLRSGTAVKKDGTFQIRTVRGEPLELTVVHPMLRAAKTGGVVATKGGARNVVLKLVAGTEITFKVAGLEIPAAPSTVVPPPGATSVPMPSRAFPGRRVPVSYRVYAGATTEGDPLRSGNPTADGDVLRIGGLSPGTYTLFLERQKFAPKVIRGVELGEGVKDIGTLQFTKGSTVRFQIVVDEGKAVPNVWASLQPVDGPRYWRSAGSQNKAEFEIPAVGAGRFKLVVNRQSGPFSSSRGGPILEKEITVDGSNDLDITVDAR